jgi:hypothetical protein
VKVGADVFSSLSELVHTPKIDGSALTEHLTGIFGPESPRFADAHTVIWSDESLGMAWNKLSGFIRNLSSYRRVKVIVYFRNQTEWLTSAYLQWAIKDKQTPGRIRSWEEFLRDWTRMVDYISIIEGWKKSAPLSELVVRSYDATDNVVCDFFSIIQPKTEIRGVTDRVYETPGYTPLALFKILHDQYEEPRQPEPLFSLMQRAGVLSHKIHNVDPCPLDISDSEISNLAAGFSDVNRRLRDEYGLDLKASVDQRRVSRRDHSSATNTDLVAALLMMILQLDQNVKALQSKVESLTNNKSC